MALFKNLDQETPLNTVGRVLLALVGAVGLLGCIGISLGGVISIIEGGDRVVDAVMLVAVWIAAYGSYRLMRFGLDGKASSSPSQSHDTHANQQRTPQQQVDSSRQTPEEHQREALRLARDLDGRLTVAELALETSLDIDAARALLDELASDGVADLQVTDSGNTVYVFPAFVDGGRGKLSARSVLDRDAEVELEFDKLAEDQAKKNS